MPKGPLLLLSRYLIVFFVVITSGCSMTPTPGLPELPDIGIDVSLLNKDLKIDFFPNSNTFKIGDEVVLSAMLITPGIKIRTTNNCSAKMFFLDDTAKRWVEVRDVITHTSQGYFIIDKNNDRFPFFLQPDLTEKSKDATLLIMITGDVMDGDVVTGRITGAYKVVTLKP